MKELRAAPKPQRPERGTARAKRWMTAVADLPCMCCGARPVEVHHVIMGRHSQRRASDLETLPLCPAHHRELHASPVAWREQYGPDHGFLPAVRMLIERMERDRI